MAVTISGGGTISGASNLGNVLQVKQNVMSGQYSTTSNSFVFPTDLTISITPSSTTSKILITTNIWVASSYYLGLMTLQRNGTDIGLANTDGNRPRYFLTFAFDSTPQTSHGVMNNVTGELLDSPNTTSSVTYRVGIAGRPDNANTVYINRSDPHRDVSSTYDTLHVSTITVKEIAA